MFIDAPLDDIPDRLESINPGVRTLVIKDITTDESDDGTMTIVTELEVDEPGTEDHERKHWERFNFKYQPARVKFKQMVKAAGHSGTGDGIDTSELIGNHVRAVAKAGSYKDKDTGETKETTRIKEFVVSDVEAESVEAPPSM